MQTNLRRIVHGNPEQPESSRDIKGFTPCQFKHLIESLQTAFKEAAIMVQLTDQGIQQVMYNVNRISPQFGLPKFDFTNITVDQYREYQKERLQVIGAMLQVLNQPYPGMEYSQEEKDWEGDFRIV